jgi:hypothetical protein
MSSRAPRNRLRIRRGELSPRGEYLYDEGADAIHNHGAKLSNYNIPTDMQAPFHPSRAFSPAPWSAAPAIAHQPTTAHRPMQAIQCTTAAAPLSSSESRESGRGRWWRWRNRLPACGNNRLPIASAAARPLSDRGGGESSFPHQGTPCQRTALSHTRVPLASAQRARHPPDGARYGAPSSRRRSLRRAILPTALATARRLPTALATARHLPTAPRDRLRVRARAAPCGRTCHSPSQ